MKFSFLFLFILLFYFQIQAETDQMCEDLFAVACTDSKGKNKFVDEEKKREEEAKKIIQEAQDSGARSMGYKDLEDGIKSRLKEKGLSLVEPIEPASGKEKSLRERLTSLEFEDVDKLFEVPSQCSKLIQEFEKAKLNHKSNPEKLNSWAEKLSAKSKTTHDLNVSKLASNLSVFVSNYLGGLCRKLDSDPKSFRPEHNQRMIQLCQKMPSLRRESVQLYRKEGSSGYKEEAEKFVRENMPESLIRTNGDEKNKSKKAPNPRLDKVHAEFSKLEDTCHFSKNVFQLDATNVVQEFMTEVNTSKPTIEILHGKYFNESNWKKASQMFNSVRDDMKDIAKQITSSKEKQDKIIEEFAAMEMKWLERPEDFHFKKGPKGALILDEEKIESSNRKFAMENPYSKFADPELSYFQDLNANYLVAQKVGEKINKERIEMMPAYLMKLEKSPWRFLSVLAHEFGHKIDPNIAATNGHDLKNEYKETLACFSDPKSIRMSKDQQGETISDAISAEYLARQLVKMTPDQRRRTLIQAAEPYCFYDANGEKEHSIHCKGNHPENSLRVSGIIGANPNVRKAIGCEKESSQFKTCGISGVNLPGDSSAGPSNSRKTQQVQGTQGVE